jgi:hypothetical protein
MGFQGQTHFRRMPIVIYIKATAAVASMVGAKDAEYEYECAARARARTEEGRRKSDAGNERQNAGRSAVDKKRETGG